MTVPSRSEVGPSSMQIRRKHAVRATGLKRELKVVVGQGELSERFTTRLDEVKDQVQLKGFRKGKVPVRAHQEAVRPLA